MLLVFSGMFISINDSKAQCLPDCPADAWSSPPSLLTVTIAPGCVMEISYSHRFACGTWYDYYVNSVVLTSSGGCSFAASDIDEVIDEATIALLANNPQNFPSQCGAEMWRASAALCWRKDGSSYTPCPPVVCNLTRYTVCNGVVTQTATNYPPVTCTFPCVSVDPLTE